MKPILLAVVLLGAATFAGATDAGEAALGAAVQDIGGVVKVSLQETKTIAQAAPAAEAQPGELTPAETAEVVAAVQAVLDADGSDAAVIEAVMVVLKKQGHSLSAPQAKKMNKAIRAILSKRCEPGWHYIGNHQCQENERPSRGRPSGGVSCSFGCSSLDHCDNGNCISNGNSGHCSSMDHDDGFGSCVSNSSGSCQAPLHWNGSGCN